MKVIVVDDEPLARDGILLSLQQKDDIEVIAVCSDGYEAVKALNTRNADLIFLDINMPGMNGFDVIAQVGVSAMPLVVFLTAHNEYAVDAFTVNALDYLLKPIDEKRFTQTLIKCREVLRQQKLNQISDRLSHLMQEPCMQELCGQNIERYDSNEQLPDRIMIRNAGHVFFIRPDEIRWVEAEGDYVSLHTSTRSHLVRETMKNMERKLSRSGFQRIHRSSLVRLDMIRELVANESGDYAVVLHDDTVLKLSRNYRDILYEKLESRSDFMN